MVVLGRSVGSQSMSRSNMMLSAIVLFVVVALFFIPEIVGYQRKQTDYVGPIEAEAPVESSPMASLGPDAAGSLLAGQETAAESPLTQVSRLLDQTLKSLSGNSLPEAETNSITNQTTETESVTETPGVQDKKAEQVLSENPLTIERLKSREVLGVFDRARSEALSIASQLPKRSIRSRYALFNYAAALSAVSANPAQFGEPTDAVVYIENLDASVTRAMLSEGVDRTDFLRWASVSLGNDLRVSRAARLKNQYNIPFNPRLTLANVSITHPGDRTTGRYDEPGQAYVDFDGIVVGKDSQRIEILLDGKMVGEYVLPEPDPATARRSWSFRQGDARGVYTIRVHGNNGEVYNRYYSFYPKVRAFAWVSATGQYAIPYNAQDDKINRQLDRFFLTAGNKGGATNSSIGTF
jgi:hypothetical protein